MYPKRPSEISVIDATGSIIYSSALIQRSEDSKYGVATNTSPFSAYSTSGIATGKLIYVNYGREKDFKHLEASNISCVGKIVLLRYGKILEDTKVFFVSRRLGVQFLTFTRQRKNIKIIPYHTTAPKLISPRSIISLSSTNWVKPLLLIFNFRFNFFSIVWATSLTRIRVSPVLFFNSMKIHLWGKRQKWNWKKRKHGIKIVHVGNSHLTIFSSSQVNSRQYLLSRIDVFWRCPC